VVQKQPLVVRHSSHENLPADLLSPSLEASQDTATPSGDPVHPRPSVAPAAAVRPALLQLQAVPQQTDISASKAAAHSQNKSVSATGKFRATAPGDVKSDVLPSITQAREPFAAVQVNSISTNAAQSSGSHSSSTASGRGVQRSMAQSLQSQLADPYQLTAVRQVGDPAMLRRSEPASDSGLCSSSGSFGLSSHHTSQQASRMRLPVSTSSGDTAASSSMNNTDAIKVGREAAMSHELADRDEEAVSTSKTRAESLAAVAASLGGKAGPSDDALWNEAGNHAREEDVVQTKAAKAKSGAGKTGKQAKNKGPSIEVGGNMACNQPSMQQSMWDYYKHQAALLVNYMQFWWTTPATCQNNLPGSTVQKCLLHANHNFFTGASMVMAQRQISLRLNRADPEALQLQELAVPLIAPLHDPADTTQLGISQALCSTEHFVLAHSQGEKPFHFAL